jgi:hypothetical protein
LIRFDPFEEQLHLPALFVKSSDCFGGRIKIVCQKYEPLVCFSIAEPNAPEMFEVAPEF